MTRQRLDMYASPNHALYNSVTGDAKTMWGKIKSTPETIKNIWDTAKKLKK